MLARLRDVVAQLESGQLSLEDSLRVYEEGVQMARRGHQLLDRAEKRVELLVRAGQSGIEVAPFEAQPTGGDDDDEAGGGGDATDAGGGG